MSEETAPQKVHNELQEEIKQAIKSDGYFIMITRKQGNQLFHRQFMVGYNILDMLLSIFAQWETIDKKHERLIADIKKRQKTGRDLFGFIEKIAKKIQG